jgi:2-keto-3-deoxy-L-rhamnonate aldolase RhmA
VEGVDVLFVGPFDLAKSMDIEIGGEEHERTIEGVLRACKENKKKAAIFCECAPPRAPFDLPRYLSAPFLSA